MCVTTAAIATNTARSYPAGTALPTPSCRSASADTAAKTAIGACRRAISAAAMPSPISMSHTDAARYCTAIAATTVAMTRSHSVHSHETGTHRLSRAPIPSRY
ncbi:hypothetical protein ACIA8K_40090 [Catenuloplanes sp. NPDC051500]|uniref:hypothetical protein n=1 Tax=Catenuloplanes sp. NPDC051500 TaxID=3363959 RepID=UPI00378851C8